MINIVYYILKAFLQPLADDLIPCGQWFVEAGR